MKKLLTLAFLLSLTLTLSACSNVKNFYFSYINPPTKMNYNNVLKISESGAVLSDNLIHISEELAKFQYSFDLLQQPPIAEDLQDLFNTYPWLSGTVLLNASGSVGASMPEYHPMFPFASFLEVPKKADERAVRTYAIDDFIIIAKPVFDNTNTLLGLTLIYFKFENLVNYFNNFNKDIFIFAGKDNILLSQHQIANTPFDSIDWQKQIKNKSSGIIKDKNNGSAEWIVRYLYNYPLVFAIQE